MLDFSAPSLWKRILRRAVLFDFLYHQIDFHRLAEKQSSPFRASPVAATQAFHRLVQCDML